MNHIFLSGELKMNKKYSFQIALIVGVVFGTMGCANNKPPLNEDGLNRELTVGLVQREIKEGSPAEEVIRTLGSPNIVKTDADGLEVWVYDRFSSERVRRSFASTLLGISDSSLGLFQGSSSKDQSSVASLTVILNFDKNSNVSGVAYHRSKF